MAASTHGGPRSFKTPGRLPALALVCSRGDSCDSGPALLGAEWCWAAAKAIATLSCPYFHAALRRRSLLRFAADVAAESTFINCQSSTKSNACVRLTLWSNAWWWWWWCACACACRWWCGRDSYDICLSRCHDGVEVTDTSTPHKNRLLRALSREAPQTPSYRRSARCCEHTCQEGLCRCQRQGRHGQESARCSEHTCQSAGLRRHQRQGRHGQASFCTLL